MENYTTKQQAAKGASSPHAGKIHSLLASFTTEEALLKTRSAAIAQGFYSFRVYLSCIFEHTLKDFENVPHLQPRCHPGGDMCHTSRHPATQEGTCATPPTTLPPSRGQISSDFLLYIQLQASNTGTLPPYHVSLAVDLVNVTCVLPLIAAGVFLWQDIITPSLLIVALSLFWVRAGNHTNTNCS